MNANTVRESLRSEGIDDKTIGTFLAYHEGNPDVWKHFERFAQQALARRKRIGAKAIFERIRWEVEMEQNKEFKANNNFCSYYARIFELKHPLTRGFFEKRAIRGLTAY